MGGRAPAVAHQGALGTGGRCFCRLPHLNRSQRASIEKNMFVKRSPGRKGRADPPQHWAPVALGRCGQGTALLPSRRAIGPSPLVLELSPVMGRSSAGGGRIGLGCSAAGAGLGWADLPAPLKALCRWAAEVGRCSGHTQRGLSSVRVSVHLHVQTHPELSRTFPEALTSAWPRGTETVGWSGRPTHPVAAQRGPSHERGLDSVAPGAQRACEWPGGTGGQWLRGRGAGVGQATWQSRFCRSALHGRWHAHCCGPGAPLGKSTRRPFPRPLSQVGLPHSDRPGLGAAVWLGMWVGLGW